MRTALAALGLLAAACAGAGSAVPTFTPAPGLTTAPALPTVAPSPVPSLTATQPPPSPAAAETATDEPIANPTVVETATDEPTTDPTWNGQPPTEIPSSPPPTDAETQSVATHAAARIIHALQSGDMATVARYVSPAQGLDIVSISYSFTCQSLDMPTFSPEQVRTLFSDESLYSWNCSGELQQHKFRQFFLKHMMTDDFTKPDQMLYNGAAFPTYPNTVEYHRQAGHMTIEYVVTPEGYFPSGLALVFAREDEWRLIEVVNDGWTP